MAEVEDVARPSRRRARGRRAPPPRCAPTGRTAPRDRGCPARRGPRRPPPSPRRAGCASRGRSRRRPTAAIDGEQRRRCRCRSGSWARPRRAARRAPAPTTARRTPRSRPARARRPTSRRAARRRRPRAPARPRTRANVSASLSSSARQTSGSRVHQRLRDRELARRLALDEVAGDGERPAAEADDRLVGPRARGARSRSPRASAPPSPPGRARAAARPRPASAPARATTGPTPSTSSTSRPIASDRGHDVREHHGRVHVVPAHRLQRHLGGQLGRPVDLEERVLLADRAVLGQRASGLPHEPHRRPLDGFTPRGADEQRFHAA